ncbi:substrate-binding domain-containing protein [Intrasporangium sp.]|uniref:substrate-binding domain-containing protein n=1 Tax=Intrasporangium sp. TaxID=1925024 RepID=UPI00293B141E|nr:substrate-binding domain-containing protein [Intrasporangium sp.]MDV3223179.1 substrate-binding and VWA domain-containing protein [Intrasporangium sp.]
MTAGGGPASGEGPEPAGRRIGPYEQSLREATRRTEQETRAARRRHSVLAAVTVVALAVAGFVGWRLLGPEPPPTTIPSHAAAPASCDDATPVTIAAAPAVAAIVASLAEDLSTHEDGPCAAFTIESIEASTVAGTIGTSAEPDAWVTDSAEWIQRAQSLAARELTVGDPFASSGVVVALPRATADELGDNPTWSTVLTGSTPVRVPDPNRSALGSAVIGAAAPGLAPDQVTGIVRANASSPVPDLKTAAESTSPVGVVVPAAQLLAFNESSPGSMLAAVAPVEGAPFLGYTLVSINEKPEVAGLVAEFEEYLGSDAARDALAEAGFTTPDGPEAQVPTPLHGVITEKEAPEAAVLSTVRSAWASASPKRQTLLALDVSGSLLRRTEGGTRLDVLKAAVSRAVAGIQPSNTLALWAYSLHIGTKGDDFKVLLDAGAVGDSKHFLAVRNSIADLDKTVGGDRGLYDTIAATYQRAVTSFAKGFDNSVVIVADGPNDDDYGASLEILIDRIKALKDPARPVRIDIVGLGTEPDAKVMTQIAELTGGRYLPAPEPKDLLPALTQVLGSGRP